MRFLINYIKRINEINYLTLSASIAFFIVVNGSSLTCLLINVCNLLGYNIVDFLQINSLPNELSSIINIFLIDATRKNYSILYIIITVISTSSMFFHFIKVLEIINATNRNNSYIKNRIASVILIVLLLVISFFLFLILLLGLYLTRYSYLNVIVKNLMIVIIPLFLITFLNKFCSPIKVKFKEIYIGIIFSTVFCYVITTVFSFYLEFFFRQESINEVLSFIFVFMIWIYLLSQGVIIGFIINRDLRIHSYDLRKLIRTHSKGVK